MTATSRQRPGTAAWAAPVPARLRPSDLAALASVGLRTRKLRAGLSALGIAIGVAAIVAVLGLAASSSAALLAQIQALGTNLLTVTNGQDFQGNTAELPATAPGMIARLPGVTCVPPGGAFYAFMNISTHLGRTLGGRVITDSTAFCLAALASVHVALVMGSAFGAEGYARLSFATDKATLERGFDAIEKFLQG